MYNKYVGKKIIFKALNKTGYDTQNPPIPASSMIPQWWKNETPYQIDEKNPTGGKFRLLNGIAANATFKKCTPMLDGLTSGYLITLCSDVFVEWVNGAPQVSWRTNHPIFSIHGPSSERVPCPPGYSNFVYKYNNTWIPITPPGYSILVTSPFGYQDTPFKCIPAVIDSDKSRLDVVPPMWLKDGFEGVIEKGTPLIQITPFKREDWSSEIGYFEDGEWENIMETNFRSTLINHYIKNIWSKKTYK